MTNRNLEFLFRPKSIAVLGASAEPGSYGSVVMDNLLRGAFSGPIMPVTPDHVAVKGIYAYPDVASLPYSPEMAVICSPPPEVPGLIRQLGEKGCKAAIVLSGGFDGVSVPDGHSLRDMVRTQAAASGMRLLGPDCVGLLVPGVGLNASFTHCTARPGKVAFVSQSSALCTAVLDWAADRNVGFSHFISLGEALDVDFGDILDYLGSDSNTNAILLYIDAIEHARKFISAARAASRNKPVLAIKSGRSNRTPHATVPHSGSAAAVDEVYEAVLRRAGILRVTSIEELFEAVETLSRTKPPKGDRMAVIANSGALGMLAVDSLLERGGKLAEFSSATVEKLNQVLPGSGNRGNPLNIFLTATGERYAQTLSVLMDAPEVDTILVMHCPGAVISATEVAMAVAAGAKASRTKKPIETCWIGAHAVQAGRDLFAASGISSYETPEQAIRAYMHLIHYRRTKEILMETPASVGLYFKPDIDRARAMIAAALEAGHTMLNEHESKEVLAAYGIPVVTTRLARNPQDAAEIAAQLDFPVALKIWSDDIVNKSDVGGVVLDLSTPEEVRQAGQAMLQRVARTFPGALIQGFTVQTMARRPGAHELIMGVTDDEVFGPVMVFGQGGTGVEVVDDRAVTLPPLNMNLARDLMSQTRVAKLLEGYSNRPPADRDAVAVALCRLSQMVVDFPEIRGIDVNPVLADANGIIALDARIVVSAIGPNRRGADRLAIRPYPKELEEDFTMKDGRKLLLRPIRPEDEPAHHVFHSKLSIDDIRFRHFGLVKAIPHDQMARMTQIDYDREMAFIAVHGDETMGVARVAMDPDLQLAEFAIIVRSDLKGQGVGAALLTKVTNYCRQRGVLTIEGQTMRENKGMIGLSEHLGFAVSHVEDGIVMMTKQLNPPQAK